MRKPIRKVAFLLPWIVMGGVEKLLLEVLKEMRKQKPDWEITIYSRHRVKDNFFIDFFKRYGISLRDRWFLTKPTKFFPKLGYKLINIFYKRIAPKIAKYCIVHGRYDVLIDFHFFSFAREIKKLSAPKITWGQYGILHFNRNSSKVLKYMEYYDRMVGISDSFKEDFSEQYPDYKNKIVCIPNSINVKEIRERSKPDESRGKYFCVVSRLTGDKDNETTISAFKIFAIKHRDAKLYIAGEGYLEEKLKKMATNCPQIEFLGKIDEPYTLIRNSVGHILSSHGEGYPMVLLENAALGTLSISSRCKSGPPEILMGGEAGILFTPGDQQELARILDEVWTGKIDTKKLIQTATDNLGRFSAQRNTGRIIDLIEEIYNEKSG